jgi:hypothetical protein
VQARFHRRRALLDGVIRLSCRTDVQQDVRRVLGRVPPESHEAYSLAHELYGTTRMLLAVLGRQQLAEVCQVRRGLGGPHPPPAGAVLVGRAVQLLLWLPGMIGTGGARLPSGLLALPQNTL